MKSFLLHIILMLTFLAAVEMPGGFWRGVVIGLFILIIPYYVKHEIKRVM